MAILTKKEESIIAWSLYIWCVCILRLKSKSELEKKMGKDEP